MLWEKCTLRNFYKYISLRENLMFPNQLDVTYQKANMVVKTFIKSKTNGVQLLQAYFKDYRIVVQYFFAILLANTILSRKNLVLLINLVLCFAIKNIAVLEN